MVNFVDIETVYDNEDERDLNYLEKIYADKTRMRSIIHRMFSDHIVASTISGKSVLLKPNWVRHELKESDYLCLRTNDNLLCCVLEEVLMLSPSRVLIGDAPVQGCAWDKMITKDFLREINKLSECYGIPVAVKDFRRTITDVENGTVSKDIHPMSDYIIFDLGSNSYLEPITTPDNKFRVTCYNPDRMAEVHHKGMHKYCIAKDVFEYDIIITIPKLKTHRMAGMTNALKLLVGINGDKDFLPHHRIGSVKEGGDNYRDKSLFRTLSNKFIDEGNRRKETHIGGLFNMIGSLLWKCSSPTASTLVNAGWYGNDTIWRTIMDINTIALFGDIGGEIHEKQQRRLITFMDGIIGGQGDGPLHPEPSQLGIIAMSDNSYLMDVVAGKLYHLNLDRIPLLRESQNYIINDSYMLFINGKNVTLDDVERFGIDIEMPPGWKEYNN